MKRPVNSILWIFLLVMKSNSWCAPISNYFDHNWGIGISVAYGWNFSEYDSKNAYPIVYTPKKNTPDGRLTLNFYYNRYLGLEIGVGGREYQNEIKNSPIIYATSLLVVGMPIGKNFSIHGKIGVSILDDLEFQANYLTRLAYGGALEYKYNKHFTFFLDWLRIYGGNISWNLGPIKVNANVNGSNLLMGGIRVNWFSQH